ncbi:hypothetical protein AMELA_G00099740 [Ameiurus melas]|uniref:Uncharacterized protein n=1 Tax=Ameiurus melas TaxID=219545 RepID=A0A7J6AWB8_AMEME|nr:hypothetical protein AMELA_G00099740 [Ameiurus melas]
MSEETLQSFEVGRNLLWEKSRNPLHAGIKHAGGSCGRDLYYILNNTAPSDQLPEHRLVKLVFSSRECSRHLRMS